jgi:hypothetical protein
MHPVHALRPLPFMRSVCFFVVLRTVHNQPLRLLVRHTNGYVLLHKCNSALEPRHPCKAADNPSPGLAFVLFCDASCATKYCRICIGHAALPYCAV